MNVWHKSATLATSRRCGRSTGTAIRGCTTATSWRCSWSLRSISSPPPQKASTGGETFAPGFFVWNSEVGKRSVGIQTFWYESICQNHIVWDATKVVEFTRKHTGKVGEALSDIRRIVEELVTKRDARRDGFTAVIRKAMEQTLGEDAEEAMKALTKNGIPRGVAKKALEIAEQKGRFTIFALVDALTRLAGARERGRAD